LRAQAASATIRFIDCAPFNVEQAFADHHDAIKMQQ